MGGRAAERTAWAPGPAHPRPRWGSARRGRVSPSRRRAGRPAVSEPLSSVLVEKPRPGPRGGLGMQPHRCSWAGRESWRQPSRRQEAVGRWPVSWRPRWQPPTPPLEARGRPGDQPESSRGRGQGCLPPLRGCLEEEDPGRRSLFHRSAPHPQAREGGGPAENRTQPRGWERQDILSSTWGNSALPWRRGRCRGGRPQHICAQREAAQGVAGPLRCGGQCGCGCPCPTL